MSVRYPSANGLWLLLVITFIMVFPALPTPSAPRSAGGSDAEGGAAQADRLPSQADGLPSRTCGLPSQAGSQADPGSGARAVSRAPSPRHLLNLSQGGGAGASEYGASVDGGGDFDGDGYRDIIVGAPGAAAYDFQSSKNPGAAYLHLGREDMLGASLGAEDADVTFNGSFEISEFGQVVSFIGDFNDDGYDDIAVGEPRFDHERGRVYIFLGRDLTGMLDPDDTCYIGSEEADITLEGDDFGHRFGASISPARDADGDGYDDLLVGAPGGDRAHLYFGADGSDTWIDLPEMGGNSTRITEFDGGVSSSANTFYVSPLDPLDDDEWDWDDGVYTTGVPGDDREEESWTAGKNLYGSTGALRVRLDTYAEGGTSGGLPDFGTAAWLSGAFGVQVYIPSGAAAAAGAGLNGVLRFNYAGADTDLRNSGTGVDNGCEEAAVVKARFGDSSTMTHLGAETADALDILPDVDYYPLGAVRDDHFWNHASLEVGPLVTSAGWHYLDIGAAQETWTDPDEEGRVFFFDNISLRFGPNAHTTFTGPAGSSFGHSVTVSPSFNGDTYPDLFIGAPGQKSWEGNVSGFWGGSYLRLLPTFDSLNANMTLKGDGADCALGYAVEGRSDLNDDGRTDIAAGGFGNYTVPGRVMVHPGSISPGDIGLVMPDDANVSVIWGPMEGGPSGSDLFGRSLGGGHDLDDDGRDDLVVGSRAYHDGVYVGAMFAFAGDPDMPGGGPAQDGVYHADDAIYRSRSGDVMGGFALDLACVNDINEDGFHDIVAGDPMAGDFDDGYVNLFSTFQAPELEFLSPLENAVISGVDYLVRINATDADEDINETGVVLACASDAAGPWTNISTIPEPAEAGSSVYEYELDTTKAPNGEYYLRARSWDEAGLSGTGISGNFTVLNYLPPDVTYLGPWDQFNGTPITLAGEVTVNATAVDMNDDIDGDGVRFWYSPVAGAPGGGGGPDTSEDPWDAGREWTLIGTDPSPDTFVPGYHEIDFDTTSVPDGYCYIRVNSTDDRGLTGTDHSPILFIDNLYTPQVEVITPNGTVVLSGTVWVNASASDRDGDIGPGGVEFFLSTTDYGWESLGSDADGDGDGTYSIQWDTEAHNDSDYYILANATDATGLTGEGQSPRVTVLNEYAPEVRLIAPDGGETLAGETVLRAYAFDRDRNLHEDGVAFFYSRVPGPEENATGGWGTADTPPDALDPLVWTPIGNIVITSMSPDFLWELPWDTETVEDGTYWLKVSAKDDVTPLANTGWDISNGSFTVYNPHAPRVRILYPLAGAIIKGPVTMSAEAWDLDDDITDDGVAFYISSDDGANWTHLGDSGPPILGAEETTANNGATIRQYGFTWNSTGVPDMDGYLLRAVVADEDGLEAQETLDGCFTVKNDDGPPPTDGLDGLDGGDGKPAIFSGEWIRQNFLCGVIFLIVIIVSIVAAWAAYVAFRKKKARQQAIDDLHEAFDEAKAEFATMGVGPPPGPGEPGYDDGTTDDFSTYGAGAGDDGYLSGYESDFSSGAGELDLDYTSPDPLADIPTIALPGEEGYETPDDEAYEIPAEGDEDEMLEAPVDDDELLGDDDDLDAGEGVPAAVPAAAAASAAKSPEEVEAERETAAEAGGEAGGLAYSLPPEDADTDELLDELETGAPPPAALATPAAATPLLSPGERDEDEDLDDDDLLGRDIDLDDDGGELDLDDEFEDEAVIDGAPAAKAVVKPPPIEDAELEEAPPAKKAAPVRARAKPAAKPARPAEGAEGRRPRPPKGHRPRPPSARKPPPPAGSPAAAADADEDPDRLDPPKVMKCRCGGDILVHSKKRPLDVQCESCGAKATLKKKKKKK